MKKIVCIFVFLVLMSSCKDELYKEPVTVDQFKDIENDIINKFGKNSYFTELSISFDKKNGYEIGVAVSKKPELLKIEEWENKKGRWSQTSEISFEKPKGMEACYFMFQLKKDIHLTELSKLIDKSKTSLAVEKEIKNTYLDITSIQFPKNGDLSKTQFIVKLKAEDKNTIFSFNYPLDEIGTKS